MRAVQLRPGHREEAGLLSELALRSKGHWGYDQPMWIGPVGFHSGSRPALPRDCHREGLGRLKEGVVARAINDRGRTAEPSTPRRRELDVLRALVVVGLVFFHSAVILAPASSQ